MWCDNRTRFVGAKPSSLLRSLGRLGHSRAYRRVKSDDPAFSAVLSAERIVEAVRAERQHTVLTADRPILMGQLHGVAPASDPLTD